ncbi:MAG: hypothetical protein ACW967_02700 [Candidatus Hodarchaeales archaeon]|jgi:hypothetical protein
MNSELKLLNLTEDEEKVYLQIVAFSQLSIEELAIYTGLGFENLTKITNELINKKYINRIESLNRFVCKFPFIETAREFSEIIDDLKVLSEGLSKFIDEQKVKILQEEEERKQKVNDDVSIKLKESDELNNQFSEKYGSIYNSINIDIKNENENLKKSLKESLNNKKTEFKTSQEDLTSNWIEKFKVYEEKASQILINVKEEFSTHSKSFDSELSIALSVYIEKITENIKQFSSNSTSLVDHSLNEGQNSVTQSQGKLFESLNNLYASYGNLINDLKTKFNDIVNTNEITIQEQLSGKKTEIKESLKSEFFIISEKINSHLDEIKNKAESTFSEQVNQQTEIKTNFLNDIETDLSQYEEFLTNSKNITTGEINQQTKDFSDLDQNLSTELKNFSQNQLESTTETIKTVSSNAEKMINENFSSIEDSMTVLFQDFTSKLINMETSVKEKSKELQSQINSNLASLIETWYETTQTFDKKTEGLLIGYDNRRQESLNNFSSIAQKQIDKWTIEQKEKILNLMTSKDQKKEKFSEIEKKSVEGFLQIINQFQAETMNEIKNKLDVLLLSHESIEGERVNSIIMENKDSFTKFADQITGTITTLGEIAKNQENKDQEDINSLMDTVKSNFISLNEKIKTDIQTTVNTLSENTNLSKSEMVTNKDSFMSKNIELVKATMDQGINEHKDTFETYFLAFQENHSLIKTELSILIENIEELSINRISSIITNILSKMEELSKIQGEMTNNNLSTVRKMEEINTLLTSFISEQYKAIEENFNQTTQELSSSIKKSENALDIRSTTLQTLESKVAEFKYPVNNSAPVFGLEGVQFHIESMFKKLKSKMTLFIPNPDLLPEEQILSAKTSQQITVISMFEIDRHREMLKKFVERDNIQIRALEPSADVPPFIGCDKDAEESLFGSYEGQEFVGMQSTQTSFIELIGKRVIASFLPLAKRISRNDLN